MIDGEIVSKMTIYKEQEFNVEKTYIKSYSNFYNKINDN